MHITLLYYCKIMLYYIRIMFACKSYTRELSLYSNNTRFHRSLFKKNLWMKVVSPCPPFYRKPGKWNWKELIVGDWRWDRGVKNLYLLVRVNSGVLWYSIYK